MTKQEYLLQMSILSKTISKKQQRLAYYREMADSPSGMNYDAVRVSKSSSIEPSFVGWIERAMELEGEIKALQIKLDTMQSQVTNAIDGLENEDYKNLLVLRYLKNYRWEQICKELYISRWTAKRWNNQAVEQLKIDI